MPRTFQSSNPRERAVTAVAMAAFTPAERERLLTWSKRAHARTRDLLWSTTAGWLVLVVYALWVWREVHR